MTKTARFSLLPSFIIISAALLAGCNDQGDTQAHPTEPQVTVHVVESAPLAVTTELLDVQAHFVLQKSALRLAELYSKEISPKAAMLKQASRFIRSILQPIRLTTTAPKANWQKVKPQRQSRT